MRVELRDGRLHRDGEPWFPVGVNYHPSAVGCRIWRDWRPDSLAEDFAAMAAAGLDTVRFFVFWRDVEPDAGSIDETILARVRQFVTLAGDAGLASVPSLLTIFMNGQLLDLPWRAGRSLFRDPELMARAETYVGSVASVLRDLDNVLAYDLGDELVHVGDGATLGRAEVAAWQARLAAAVRAADPDALVLQANEHSGITGSHGFGPDNATGLDLAGIHGYPMWAPFALESNRSAAATTLVPFLVRSAAAFAPVLVDEVAAYGAGPATNAAYLRAVTRSAAAAGALGIIAWCWQDVADVTEPYRERPNEAFVGLRDRSGAPRPALHELADFAREVAGVWRDVIVEEPTVAVLIRPRPESVSYLDGPATAARGAFYAHLLATRAHLPFELARAPRPQHRLIVCPSVTRAHRDDLDALAAFVTAGGTVLWSSGEPLHGFGGEALFGVVVEDFTLGGAGHDTFEWNGVRYPLHWAPTERAPVLAATAAEVLATFPDGTPALTCHAVGAGRAYYLAAPFEAQLDAPGRATAHAWEQLYRDVAAHAGITARVDCDVPDVEVRLLRPAHPALEEDLVLAINHAPFAVTARLTCDGVPIDVALEAKGTALVPVPVLVSP